MDSFRKLKEHPYNAYVILWFVFCVIVLLVPLVAVMLLGSTFRFTARIGSETPRYTTTNAPCIFTPKSVRAGNATTFISSGASGQIYMSSAFGGPVYNLGQLMIGDTKRVVIPAGVPAGLYVVKVGEAASTCKSPLGEDFSITTAEVFDCDRLDLNNNGRIEIQDSVRILENLQAIGSQYDLTGDGAIDLEDALLIKQNIGKTC